jgi:hypothetical protein
VNDLLAAAQTDKAFQRFLARSFGEQKMDMDGDYVMVGYAWRGHFYMVQRVLHPMVVKLPPRPSN